MPDTIACTQCSETIGTDECLVNVIPSILFPTVANGAGVVGDEILPECLNKYALSSMSATYLVQSSMKVVLWPPSNHVVPDDVSEK